MLRERREDWSGAEEAYRLADTRGDAQGAFRLGLLPSGRDDWNGAKAAWARSDERGGAAAPFELERILEDHDRELEHERLAQEWESVGGGGLAPAVRSPTRC